ncbi:MAG: hypothetical protein AVDCRST_MAG32-2697, partial [uncultured Nocardioides sp.]
ESVGTTPDGLPATDDRLARRSIPAGFCRPQPPGSIVTLVV